LNPRENKNCNLLQLWALSVKNWKYILALLLSTFLAGTACYVISHFFVYIQLRPGTVIYDPIIHYLGPFNLNNPIVILTGLSVGLGMGSSFIAPCAYIRIMIAIFIISSLRMLVLYFVPLDPPTTIIPLRDSFLENTFYQNQVITKDLFFSGHTANVILLGLVTPFKFLKKILLIAGSILGIMLVLQHVHYAIDVIAAPFFAYIAYRITTFLFNIIYKWVNTNNSIPVNLYAGLNP